MGEDRAHEGEKTRKHRRSPSFRFFVRHTLGGWICWDASDTGSEKKPPGFTVCPARIPRESSKATDDPSGFDVLAVDLNDDRNRSCGFEDFGGGKESPLCKRLPGDMGERLPCERRRRATSTGERGSPSSSLGDDFPWRGE